MGANKLLVVVDMQNDFITGVLGNDECREIVPNVVDKVKNFDGDVVYTLDTHTENYLETQEGRLLPVEHCIKPFNGWELIPELQSVPMLRGFEKNTFGSVDLAEFVKSYSKYEEVILIGVCTDICVISNAMVIKAFNPEVKVTVDSKCCAGVTVESHNNALNVMREIQINLI